MIGEILLNNNERCHSNFSTTFRKVNTPLKKVIFPLQGLLYSTIWPASEMPSRQQYEYVSLIPLVSAGTNSLALFSFLNSS
jgi:hypothetical protein